MMNIFFVLFFNSFDWIKFISEYDIFSMFVLSRSFSCINGSFVARFFFVVFIVEFDVFFCVCDVCFVVFGFVMFMVFCFVYMFV